MREGKTRDRETSQKAVEVGDALSSATAEEMERRRQI